MEAFVSMLCPGVECLHWSGAPCNNPFVGQSRVHLVGEGAMLSTILASVLHMPVHAWFPRSDLSCDSPSRVHSIRAFASITFG